MPAQEGQVTGFQHQERGRIQVIKQGQRVDQYFWDQDLSSHSRTRDQGPPSGGNEKSRCFPCSQVASKYGERRAAESGNQEGLNNWKRLLIWFFFPAYNSAQRKHGLCFYN